MGFLIRFFIRNGIKSKRTVGLSLLGLVPVGCGLILSLFHSALSDQGISVAALFPRIGFFLFLHFLLPIMSVFIGSAIIADEVEDRTLPYLLVRPVRKYKIILSKTVAGCITTGIILFSSLLLTYAAMTMFTGFKGSSQTYSDLLRSGGVLLLGLLVYVPLFGLLGGVMKHPVLGGLLFTFGWENMVAFFPGNVKFFTIVHYLHILFPKMPQTGAPNLQSALLSLVLPTKEMQPMLAAAILVCSTILFTGLSVLLLYHREYRLEQS